MIHPCALCGHPDARHRVWDALLDRFLAGESIDALADDYGLTVVDTEAQLRRALTAEGSRVTRGSRLWRMR